MRHTAPMKSNPYKSPGHQAGTPPNMRKTLRDLRILFGVLFAVGLIVSFWNNYTSSSYVGEPMLYLKNLSPAFVLIRLGLLALFVYLVRYPIFRHFLLAWYLLGLSAVVVLVILGKNHPSPTDWLALALGLLAFGSLYGSPQARVYYGQRGRNGA